MNIDDWFCFQIAKSYMNMAECYDKTGADFDRMKEVYQQALKFAVKARSTKLQVNNCLPICVKTNTLLLESTPRAQISAKVAEHPGFVIIPKILPFGRVACDQAVC